jgi:hypothetical protein
MMDKKQGIGAVNEIARLESILLPHPDSWYVAESKLVEFKNGSVKEKVVYKEKITFRWLRKLMQNLEDTLKSEGISVTYLYFSPTKEDEEKSGNVISLYCNPSYLSCSLGDIGIFTKSFFLSAKQSGYERKMYGDISKKFAEKVSSFGIEVKYGEFERGAFISNGEVGFITMKNDLRKYPELLKECGELYEFSRLNCHIDSFVNFLNKELFVVNSSCVWSLAEKIEYIWCDFSTIDEIVNILKKKGYNPIKINEYYDDSSCIVGNFLNLGNNKIVVIDNKNYFSKKLEKESVDVINLYEEESFEHLRELQAGLRCITLPIKRDY